MHEVVLKLFNLNKPLLTIPIESFICTVFINLPYIRSCNKPPTSQL